ncbi:DNA methyltransferase [Limnohabitans sp. B9-3]|uniref:class I SAM-dependent DNA methyltransferase n=1 Tax=Limnohabitans sp. B9-3 TaxID=1100707 RepID=UPI000C1E9803|nr:DNA methyltransferase [Limnohabitans sp. B9-3]PIT76405.1 SAM-dependent methyltransferase [Limnohabitans sp. B9-3]
MGLNWNEIKSRALLFSKTWADATNEDSEAKPFWIAFFEIFGITDKRVATFELNVKKLGGAQGFVDLFWPGVLLVEHKSRGKNLDDAVAQAVGYLHNLPERDLPQLVVVCDFARFRVRILATGETVEFELQHLHKHVKLFGLLAGYKVQDIRAEDPVNIKAALALGRLHDALKASGYEGHALEVLLVRLLFCLFADDTGIFQPAQSFRDFVEERTAPDGSDLGPRLSQLFQVLNTHEASRNKHIDEQLAKFAYINGKLFEETLPMADFSTAMREALLDACALDWSAISPAIFGSLFQSIMEEKARRNLGAHYTSEANILKLIKPLFLDELHAEFERVKGNRNKLFEFHKKLRQLTFFDPACGCGNFLVISYRELRELELKVLRADHELSAHKGQLTVDVHALIGVNVDQFFGIEIEEFPAQIAQVALWLVDHQMNLRVSVEFGLYFARIPLKSTPHIQHGNALRVDWNDVLPAQRCSYVLGNPPFLGKTYQSKEQKADLAAVMQGIHGAGDLDFVCGWYVLVAQYLQGRTGTQAAFVSTNSITQGEQVAVLWGEMQRLGMHTHFAHRTFQWTNEASGKAAVHCVIVGFGPEDQAVKTIYEYEDIKGLPHAVPVKRINAYLVDAPDVFLNKRTTPVCNVSPMANGGKATDGGNLLMSDDEKAELIAVEPKAEKWIRPFLMGDEFINNIGRWCLWLVNIPPAELRAMPHVLKRVEGVRAMREASTKAATVALASTPTLFGEIRQPKSNRYLAIPKVSSERRQFIPIGYLESDVICGDKIFFVDDASLLTFGVLTSTMHNAWMRYTCGRLKSDYSYSNTIVYNNYPWPGFAGEALSDKHRTAIEQAAQCVLDARAQFASSSLADLYDPLTMPPALLKAHQKLNTAVDSAYQPSGGKKTYASDAERVAFLFDLYQRITSLLPVPAAKKTRKTKATEN